ncbi:MAG: hypothetical protein LBM12_02115 [Candidatus Nomurabacteria bacterium]|jgi:UDP-N-acetylmuramoylalanine--D-glutamate ligase|nr:hypothetical protein [Candidatus Nomurabacteria bacterium]
MKIAILGYGLEGKAAERYFRNLYPEAEFEIFDKVDFGVQDYATFDFVVRTPSISPYLLKSAKKITSNTIEFFAKCPCPIVGITGTKGKSTTSALTAAILTEVMNAWNTQNNAARKVYLVGNIGEPSLGILPKLQPDDAVVYELSSYQLWDLAESPAIAVYTPIAADHLDVHRDLDDYLAAKKHLTEFQGSDDAVINYGKNPDFDLTGLQLLGEHNRENALSAVAAARAFNARFVHLAEADFEQATKVALANFRGLPHRLEFVAEVDDVKFFDDNFSSASPAVAVAVQSFDEPLIVIAGGYDRKLKNYKEVAKSILQAKDLRGVALIGETAPKIAKYLPRKLYKVFPDLRSAVEGSARRMRRQGGGVVLMSPGAPSFDMFRDFKDRGEQFQQIVRGLASSREEGLLNQALFLAYILSGLSYYKAFPTRRVRLPEGAELTAAQIELFNAAYQEGLGQFAYENKLTRDDLAHFNEPPKPKEQVFAFDGYDFDGQAATFRYSYGKLKYMEKVEFAKSDLHPKVISMQSGGKDSLLLATMLKERKMDFVPLFVRSGEHHPKVLDKLANLLLATRAIDRDSLAKAAKKGGKNGHIPITYILQSLALVQAILLGAKLVVVAIGDEGTEPHSYIGDLAVNHQWSKTREAEAIYSKYLESEFGELYKVYSPLRNISELKIAELFAKKCWQEFGRDFSSCNVANYRQHADNSELKWCGDCPKCANAFLLFAPYLPSEELLPLFDGQDLFAKESLQHTFKGLLGIDGVEKPFECVGSVAELRTAYHLSHPEENGDHAELSFEVPAAE